MIGKRHPLNLLVKQGWILTLVLLFVNFYAAGKYPVHRLAVASVVFLIFMLLDDYVTTIDISGHCFLMVHSATVILYNMQAKGRQSALQRVSCILLISLLFVFAFMYLVTLSYYHTFIEKVIGTLLGTTYFIIHLVLFQPRTLKTSQKMNAAMF